MKKLYVLGAGASIGHSKGVFPTIYDFFNKAKELNYISKSVKTIKPQFKQLQEYILSLFNKNIMHKRSKIDLEELLTYLEIDIDRTNDPLLFGLRKCIFDLIKYVVGRLSAKIAYDKNNEYNLLADQLREDSTIITYNWDILLDNILGRESILLRRKNETRYIQYSHMIYRLSAISESTIKHMGIEEPYSEYDASKGYYLKLHGSIDWVYCNNKSCRAYAKTYPVIDYNATYFCAECHEQMVNLIIPPVLNKRYNQYPFIRKLWNTAVKELEFAEELIIWGYRLPPTDFYSNWLLRQASNRLKKVSLINPSCIIAKKRKDGTTYTTWNREFLKAYHSIFNKKKITIYYYFNFKDYYEGTSIQNKFGIGSP